ncbi:hypothetical protein [Amycolatopsis keratiniphila]|uniref:Uncharacterized protein n=1 Tax=Amycolatopsis keratiniphila TaxID=129921 RepID=R4TE43_9PSEU|nr:hypothetical protein [Amycolatopsis keratiniphila]AGM09047.1 hypothetical protein AORI_6464 [Amycolatopsis keratiniphila]
MTMPPIGGYYPTGPGPGPMTPEQSEAMAKQLVAAFKVAFPDPAVLHKGEITVIKNELNALNAAVNGIKGEFNIVSAQTDLVRLESKPLFDLQEYLAGKKGEKPEQLKAAAAAAQKKADDAYQLTQKSLRRANQIDSALQRAVTGRVIPLGAQVTKLDLAIQQVTNQVHPLRTEVAKLGTAIQQAVANKVKPFEQRITTAARDATAALQGVRRVGTDLDTARKALNRRVTKLETQKSGQGKSSAGADAAALRREGDRTRRALRDLTAAMRGTGPGSQQFKRQIEAIEKSLR